MKDNLSKLLLIVIISIFVLININLNALAIQDQNIFADKVIKIGLFVPMSGTNADKGKRVVDAVSLAVEEMNSNGGILGGMVELIVEDDEGIPAQSVNAVTRLITAHKVPVVMGSIPSSCTIAAMVVTERNQIPHIAANSSSPKITNMGNKFIFQTIPNDAVQAVNMADFAVEDRNYKKIAILHANDDYGIGGMTAFRDRAKELGVEPLIESYNPGDKDFTSQIVKVKQMNPEALLIWGMQTEAALIVKQARQQGIDAQILGAGGIPGQTYIDLAGDLSEGTIVTITFLPDKENPDVVEFIKKFSNKYGYEPDLTSAQPYDAAHALMKAIEKSQSLDPKKIRDIMAQTKGFIGVTGEITFDEKNNVPTKRVYIAQLTDGEWILIK